MSQTTLNAAPQELPAVNSASRQETQAPGYSANPAGDDPAGRRSGPACPVRDSAKQPADAAPPWVESPENCALVRAALEEALRDFIRADLSIPLDERGDFFLVYVYGRFGLDPALVHTIYPSLVFSR